MGTIELDELEVRLGNRTILNGLSGVLRGQAIGLLGPNGAGKSTLINTLLGFHRASKGTARVFGLDTYRDRAQIRGGIGYMPENDSFIGNMSGVRFVRYMAELAGLPSAEALERAHEALFYVGLGEVRYRMQIALRDLRDHGLRAAELHRHLAERATQDVAGRDGGALDRDLERRLGLLGAFGDRDEREDRDRERGGLEREVGGDRATKVDPPKAPTARGVAGRAHG